MLFHKFLSQNERRAFGGGDFMEIQFCKLQPGTALQRILEVDCHWNLSSLYVYGDDMELFFSQYEGVLTGGTYANGETGVMDPYGVTFFNRDLADRIMAQLREKQPEDWQALLAWLEVGKDDIGFYVLGV